MTRQLEDNVAETVFILMGSNIGDRERNLAVALSKIEAMPGLEVTAVSGIYLSDAVDMEGENPPFMNQVVMADYQFRPNELLDALELIEKQLGRSDKGARKPRPIDLDILLFGEQIVETNRLSIPHRELLNRPFAMVPLLEIEPDIIHPVVKRPVAEFLDDKDRQQVTLFKDHVARNV
jgi:2-amino-4-hydroxy-6-hydroxymethyldihydropteridine diphosphokinase